MATDIHTRSVADALASLQSAAGGLSSAEAARRLREHGPNRVEPAARVPWPRRLAREYVSFFSLILWAAAGLAFLAAAWDPGQDTLRVGLAIVAVILISGGFSFWQENRIERALAALRALLPQQVTVLRDGAPQRLPAEQLVPGDLLLIEAGQRVPADLRLTEAWGLRVDLSTLTGESAPQPRDASPVPHQAAARATAEQPNLLLAGTAVVAGVGRGVVYATGGHSEFGRIAQSTQTAGDAESPLRVEIDHLSRRIAALAVGAGLLLLGLGHLLLGVPLAQALLFALGLLVAMVPEGLLPTLTLALVLASQRLARRQVLIRHLPAVETLGAATVICTDKTGTLTLNRMRLRELHVGGAEGRGLADGEPAPARLLAVAAHCHDLEWAAARPGGGGAAWLGDAMEIALVEHAERAGWQGPAVERLGELPFDNRRMRQAVCVAQEPRLAGGPGGGPHLHVKGAPETVLPLCAWLDDGRGDPRPLAEADRAAIRSAQEAMADRGLRVLALASRPLAPQEIDGGGGGGVGSGGRPDLEALEQGLIFCGLAGLEDPPRPDVAAAVATCRGAGIRVIMVTGDHPRTALAIARRIGLVSGAEPLLLTGEALQRLSATQLQLALDAPEVVFARLAPDQKMRIVEALRAKGEVVAVTGDGVNDAPALKAAHIGIAMGASGSDVAREAADMVLLDDHFASIVHAVEEGRALYANIRKFLTYVLVHNVAELLPYLAFALFGLPVALTPIQALAVDMGTDSLTALGLGVERAAPGTMQRPPRPRDRRLFDLRLALRAYAFLGLIEAGVVMGVFLQVLVDAGWRWPQTLGAQDPAYRSATTAALCALILLQVVNVYLCRSSWRSLRATGLGGNRWISAGVALELALLAVFAFTPWGHALLGTATPPASVWGPIALGALAMLAAEEARKAWLRRRALNLAPASAR